jgi:4-hydroxy-tetrahydrodipicolinate synthase
LTSTGSVPELITGIVPVIPTPFDATGEKIDLYAFGGLVEFALESNAAAVCLPAYGSEFYKLTEAERHRLVEAAIAAAAGRLPVIAQCNHGSPQVAAAFARRYVDAGADVVSFALPRLFPLPEAELIDFARVVCGAVSVPVLVQDFNPAGATVGADFCRELHAQCPNFLYIKLEEPHMGAKVKAIREATADRVAVLEGWGGLYTLELLSAGIKGVMPGLSVTDVLAEVWRLGVAGRMDEAFRLFAPLTVWLTFALTDMEIFNVLEKRLLSRRGALKELVTRPATQSLSADLLDHADFLAEQVVGVADSLSTGA